MMGKELLEFVPSSAGLERCFDFLHAVCKGPTRCFDVVAVGGGIVEHDVDAPRAHCLSLHVPLRPFPPLRPQNSASPLF